MKIQSTRDLGVGALKCAVYGMGGAGKTTLASTLDPERTFIVSAESGLLSVQDFPIDYVTISHDDDNNPLGVEERYKRLGEVYAYLLTDEAKSKYQNVVVDSVSEIADFVVSKAKIKYPDESQTFKVWGAYNDDMIKIIKSFRDLPHYNVFMLFLEEKEKDDMSRIFYGPDIPGKGAKKFIVPAFDLVMRLFVNENDKRQLLTSKTAHSEAKDRSGKLNQLEEADLTKILKKIGAK